MKAKELGVNVAEVEVPTHPVKSYEEAPLPPPPSKVDPTKVASSSGAYKHVNDVNERINSVIQDLNIHIDHILEVDDARGEDVREEIRVETVDTEEVAPTKQAALNEEGEESGQGIGVDISGGLEILKISLEDVQDIHLVLNRSKPEQKPST